jgi:CubicO group peptidase (beta-lactamase class C family)
VFSVSKTFTSVAIGIARAEGLLDLDDPVAGRSGAGFSLNSVGRRTWKHLCLSRNELLRLGRIIHAVSGLDLRDYLIPPLFEPLSIRNPQWHRCPLGFPLGAVELFLRTEGIARLGEASLNDGVFAGRRLIPTGYVALGPPGQPRLDSSSPTIGSTGCTAGFAAGTAPGGWMASTDSSASCCRGIAPASPSPRITRVQRPTSWMPSGPNSFHTSSDHLKSASGRSV